MRIDKYLKVSRLIKRREAAKNLCDNQYIQINEHPAKPSAEIREGDIITLNSPHGRTIVVKVLKLQNCATIEASREMYEILLQE